MGQQENEVLLSVVSGNIKAFQEIVKKTEKVQLKQSRYNANIEMSKIQQIRALWEINEAKWNDTTLYT